MKFFIVDAFTSVEFSGQPACVVALDRTTFIEEDVMQKTAMELGYANTIFVHKSSEKAPRGVESVWEARFFSPEAETKMYTHSIVAMFQCLMDGCYVKPGRHYLVKTISGPIAVGISSGVITLELPDPFERKAILDAGASDQIRQCFDGGHSDLPVETIDSVFPTMIVPVGSAEELNALAFDYKKAMSICMKHNVSNIHFFASDLEGSNAGGGEDILYVSCRNFSMTDMRSEVSASGIANVSLAYYMAEHGLLKVNDPEDPEDVSLCTFIQGEKMGRASRIYSQCRNLGTDPKTGMPDINVSIGGRAVVLVDGNLDLTNYM